MQALAMIQQAQVGLQAGSPLHTDVVKAVQRLSRHLPQGAPTVGVQMTGIRDLIRQISQSPFMAQLLNNQQRGQGGGPGGPAGPAPQAPMPSMPLPGA